MKGVCTTTILCETSAACLGTARQLLLASLPLCVVSGAWSLKEPPTATSSCQREKGHMGVDRVSEIPLRRN